MKLYIKKFINFFLIILMTVNLTSASVFPLASFTTSTLVAAAPRLVPIMGRAASAFGGTEIYKRITTFINETVQKSKELLHGEGEVGTYRDLTRQNAPGSDLAAHHIPNAEYLKSRGVGKMDGVAMNVESKFPGTTGRHAAIHKGMRLIDPSTTPRDALAKAVMKVRRTYIEEGQYTRKILESLLDVIKRNKCSFPSLYEKGGLF